MNDLYRDYILDHYRRPRHKGRLEEADVSHEEHNPLCGDRIVLDLRLEDGRVKDVRFDGEGCAISQAAASVLTEEILGRSLGELRQLGKKDVLESLGIDEISPARLKCALLPLNTLRAGALGLKGRLEDEESDEEEEAWPPR
ncbi:MAG: Fe-S cluster assembly sulfur transfer protein SufU [Chloroflexota bacterium]